MNDPALVFGNYCAHEPLARGGFGQVYRGEHRYLSQRVVAIKVMHNAPLQTQQERDEFLREANLLELLKHPAILPILDVGIQENVPYLITEYASGGSLRQRLLARQGQLLPFDEVLAILNPVANALHFSHEHQVIHRDLKPDNILFNARGEALLADFGIATLLSTASYHQTRVIGTPAYMAPEQFRGQVCKESDQYAFACLAYELFTGRPPFAQAGQVLDFYSWMFHHMQEQPQPLAQLNPKLPMHISAAILKALAKDRMGRYLNMLALLDALQTSPENTILTQIRLARSSIQGIGAIAPTQMAHPTSQEQFDHADRLLYQKRYKEAVRAYERATQFDPTNAAAYINMGCALDELGRYEEALQAYDQAIHLDSTNADTHSSKGHTLNYLGRYEDALKACERAIQLDPTNTPAYSDQGYALAELGRHKEALAAYERAIQLNPTDAFAHYGKGYALEKLGLPKVAKKRTPELALWDGKSN